MKILNDIEIIESMSGNIDEAYIGHYYGYYPHSNGPVHRFEPVYDNPELNPDLPEFNNYKGAFLSDYDSIMLKSRLNEIDSKKPEKTKIKDEKVDSEKTDSDAEIDKEADALLNDGEKSEPEKENKPESDDPEPELDAEPTENENIEDKNIENEENLEDDYEIEDNTFADMWNDK